MAGNTIQARKVALVTGSGRRLGRQIALAFGRAGYDVVLNYHNSRSDDVAATVRELSGVGVRAIAIKADVSVKKDVVRMISSVKRKFGRLDVLVNNAAVFIAAPLNGTTESIWERTMDANLKGVFLCSQAAAPLMLETGGGTIINIASLGGIQPYKQHLAYSVSKAGVVMLTRTLAKDLAPSITVNAIAPGSIIIPREERKNQQHLPLSRIPLKRYGNPDDITSLVLFLSQSADYMTGQILAVDGGASI